MTDNTFGYSNSGLSQSLNGISSITDGSGASITDGNAIFIDTTTNTATVNNDLTIPLNSLITLYGNIFIPAYNITLTPEDIITIGNITGITYDLPTNTTSILGNSIFGSSGALATYTTMRINSDVLLYGNINLPTFSSVITPTTLNNMLNIINKLNYTASTISTNSGISLSLYGNLFLSSTTNIIQGLSSTPATNLKNLPYLDVSSSINTSLTNINNSINNINTLLTGATYDSTYNYLKFSNNVQVMGNLALDTGLQLVLPGPIYKYVSVNTLSYVDPTSSIQTQFNNITTNYLTKSLAASTYLTQTNAASTYLTQANAASTYLTQANAASTYLTQTNASSIYLTQTNAALTYATITSLSNYLTTSSASSIYLTQTNAASTYATITSLSNYLTTSSASSTYLTQTDAASTYVTQSTLNSTLFNFISLTALNIILSDYAKLTNNNTFTNNQNIYKNIYIDDASFNTINYMQLGLTADGTTNGSNSVVGIDFTTWSGRDGASTRIYGLDNGDYSAHLVFSTASPGPAQNPSTERMRIQDDGKIGIGTQTPGYLLDVNGSMNATTIYENGSLLSSKYALITGNITGSSGSCTGNSATATRATNVSVTADNTTTNLCVALTTASITTTSVGLRVDSNLRFNAATNALSTTTFIGNLTGDCSGSSSSCTGNAATATNATNSTNVAITEDNTSTTAFIPFTLISTTVSNALLRISSFLGYNASTNTLKCNHLGSTIVPSGGVLNLQSGATSNICPIGTILMMAVQAAPSGWLACNGVYFSTTGTYASLFSVIGYTYGGSGGFFYIPDFQGAFLRGFGSPTTSRNLSYASDAIGTYQPSQIGSHSHSVSTSNNGVNTNIGSAFVANGVNVQTSTTTETRPYNYAVAYYIKF